MNGWMINEQMNYHFYSAKLFCLNLIQAHLKWIDIAEYNDTKERRDLGFSPNSEAN